MDLVERILAQVRKGPQDARQERAGRILLPREELYPVIHDILGITSWLLTPDTGLSHLANGMYNIPSTVLTKENIQHWLPPRDHVHPVVVGTKAAAAGQKARSILPMMNRVLVRVVIEQIGAIESGRTPGYIFKLARPAARDPLSRLLSRATSGLELGRDKRPMRRA